jgi:hypothetical protein
MFCPLETVFGASVSRLSNTPNPCLPERSAATMAMDNGYDGRGVEGSRGFLSHQDRLREFDQYSVSETAFRCLCHFVELPEHGMVAIGLHRDSSARRASPLRKTSF